MWLAVSGGAAPRNMQVRISALQHRVDSLEVALDRAQLRWSGSPSVASTAKAPFQVLNDKGQVIMEVDATASGGGIKINGLNGQPAIALWTDSGTATVDVRNTAQTRRVLLGVGKKALMAVMDGASGEKGEADLIIDQTGRPTLEVYNTKHANVVSITHGVKGGGAIQVSEPAGGVRVQIGTQNEDAVGVVETGPQFQCVVGSSLIPPSCIIGHKAK